MDSMEPETLDMSVIKYGTFELEWSMHLQGANGWPPPADAMLPVPLMVPARDKLVEMVMDDCVWDHPDCYEAGKVPVLFRRADGLTPDDRQKVLVLLAEKIDQYEADLRGLHSMVDSLTKGSPIGEKPMANFKVFLATEDIPIDPEASTSLDRELTEAERAYWELTELANYRTKLGYFFYADTETEAKAIAAQAREIYGRAGWDSGGVFPWPVEA